MGISSSGAYVLWISTGIFVCGSLGLLALSSKYATRFPTVLL